MVFARILLLLRQSLEFLRAEAGRMRRTPHDVADTWRRTRRISRILSRPDRRNCQLGAIYSSRVAPEDEAVGSSGQSVATPGEMPRSQLKPRRERAENVRCQPGRIAADSRNSFRTSGYPRTMHPDTVEVLRIAMRLTIRDCSSTRYLAA